MSKCFKVCPRGKGDDVGGPGWAKVSTPAELQRGALRINRSAPLWSSAANPYSFYYRVWKALRLFYPKSLHLFIGTNPFYFPLQLDKCFKVCLLRKARTEKKVPSTPCILSLFPSSRNTIHTDQVALTVHLELHPTIVNTPIRHNVNAQKIKTRKLLMWGMWRES